MKLNIKKIRDKKQEILKVQIEELKETPTMTIIQVGNDLASDIYVRNKIKKLTELGIDVNYEVFSDDTPCEIIEDVLLNCCTDGILLQLPLPDHLKEDEQTLLDCIPSIKDVDQLNTYSMGKLASGHVDILPCTVQAVIDIIEDSYKEYEKPLESVFVTIFGRSKLVGLPLSIALTHMDSVPTIIHSKVILDTEDLLDIYQPNVIVTAVGEVDFITEDMINYSGCTIIDVGINRDENGKLCGDYTPQYEDGYTDYTSVPGGVGLLTVLNVAENLVKLIKKYK